MHRSLRFSLIIASFALAAALVACSGEDTDDTTPQGGTDTVAEVALDASGETVAKETTELDTTGQDVPVGEVVDEVADDTAEEIAPFEVVMPTTCEGEPPTLPVCDSTDQAPYDAPGTTAFVQTGAIPLQCDGDDGLQWDFRIFVEEFKDKSVFMMGEVHGSNEIGPASADLFETLVTSSGVNVLVLEMSMDMTDAVNLYIETGDDSAGTPIHDQRWDVYSDKMFRKALPKRAHELYLEGVTVKAACVDAPYRLAWVNEQLEAMAADLDDAAAGVLLDTLPPPREPASYGMLGLETAYVNQARTYYEQVWDNLDTVCASLDDATCEDVKFMAYALYIGALINSQDFMMGGMGGGDQTQLMEWMKERELLINYNFEKVLTDESVKIYAHMGAAHCSWGGWNVAAMLNDDFELTQGKVYSVNPTYGPSTIFYGIMNQDLPATPAEMEAALGDEDFSRYFLSCDEPNPECVDNPYLYEAIPELGGFYGLSYDAFFWFDTLTPDSPAGWFGGPDESRFLVVLDQVQRLHKANHLLGALQKKVAAHR